MALLIRAAQPQDQDALVQIGLAAWTAGIAPLLDDAFPNAVQPFDLIEIENLFRDFIRAHFDPSPTKIADNSKACSHYLICADLGGQLLGFYALQTSLGTQSKGAEGYLSDLWVMPQWHGQGIATPLIQDALDKCRDNQQAALSLKVLKGNKRAVAFYEKNGFTGTKSLISFEPVLKRSLPRLEMIHHI
ncbi:MAG: GNAT family N-acetyltransferase [Cohaesibacter sp.]|nr:GNAT family N-acetyltransferase [Cohaesibacter sp.]MCV6601061.1 GNAT family N-acetyltransferase [Cohaesibacter sp.]